MSNASDFLIKKGVLTEYKGPGGDVIVPEGVTVIGELAKWGSNQITSLVLPESLKKIEQHAFGSDCLRMQTLLIPQNVTEISGHQLFMNCGALAVLEVSTGNPCFSSQEGVLFDREKTKLIACPRQKAGKYNVPDSVKEICDFAFYHCSELQEITIPNGVHRIGRCAFSECYSLTEITFPASVSIMDSDILDGCKKIKHISIHGTLEEAKRAAYISFRCPTCSVTVTHWTPAVTKFLSGLHVGTVETDDLSAVPAAYRERAVLGYTIKKSNTTDKEVDAQYETYLSKNAAKLCKFAFENPALLFFLCEHQLISAKNIDTYLLEAEKQGDAEKKALLLDYQNKLGTENVSKAREKKEKVKEEYEDALVERMSSRDPSKGIEGMTFVVTGKAAEFPPVWSNRSEIMSYLENYGAKLGSSITKKTDYLVTDDVNSGSEKNRKAAELGVQVISETDFNDMVGKRYKDAAHVIIPSWLKEIPGIAFYDCVNLAEVTIPNSIISIGSGAFKGHVKLTSVTIPDGVTSIGSGAFDGCSSLTSVRIPDSVTTIGSWAFRGCRRMTSVILSENVLSIGDLAFYGCPNLTIHAPAGSYAEQYAKENDIPFVAK